MDICFATQHGYNSNKGRVLFLNWLDLSAINTASNDADINYIMLDPTASNLRFGVGMSVGLTVDSESRKVYHFFC